MDEQPLLPDVNNDPKRSQLLTVLCILTFIGSGMNAFSSLFIATFFDEVQGLAEAIFEKFNLPGIEMLLNSTPQFFLVTGLLFIGSLTGAIIMWQQRRIGFHVYTISQILLVIAPMYFMNIPGVPIFEMLLSALFIILYSTQLKQMR